MNRVFIEVTTFIVISIITGIVFLIKWIWNKEWIKLNNRLESLEDSREHRDKAMSAALKVLLWDRLWEEYKKADKNGYITYDDFANVTELYTTYKLNGGEGVADYYYDLMKKLPHTEEEKQ